MIIVNVQKLDPHYLSPHDIEVIEGMWLNGNVYVLSWFGDTEDFDADSIDGLLQAKIDVLSAFVRESQDQVFVLVELVDDNVIEVVGVADMSKLYLLLRSDNVNLSSSN